ncbi:hypothetical protein [Paenibacillus alvei]|uniref:hypothetical protein n=1 Tax=Paenibacillus alvei TaxID=44250 RepID=UPI00227DE7F1|nr:hypothetical protein [Paenibacillus alvei]MCY7484402.1 hypothetical protein [Paenibacillus alvei]
MTNEELKAAMSIGEAVEYRGITYSRITAIIHRIINKKPYIQVELLDKTKNSIVIASPNEVKRVKEK